MLQRIGVALRARLSLTRGNRGTRVQKHPMLRRTLPAKRLGLISSLQISELLAYMIFRGNLRSCAPERLCAEVERKRRGVRGHPKAIIRRITSVLLVARSVDGKTLSAISTPLQTLTSRARGKLGSNLLELLLLKFKFRRTFQFSKVKSWEISEFLSLVSSKMSNFIAQKIERLKTIAYLSAKNSKVRTQFTSLGSSLCDPFEPLGSVFKPQVRKKFTESLVLMSHT